LFSELISENITSIVTQSASIVKDINKGLILARHALWILPTLFIAQFNIKGDTGQHPHFSHWRWHFNMNDITIVFIFRSARGTALLAVGSRPLSLDKIKSDLYRKQPIFLERM
jgi:hypothetical protein